MPVKKINRVMIAGTNSGCGKTTVTCAVLKALKNKGMKIASFKCGPDYIDPMFHSEILGTKSNNIDLFLCGETSSKYLFVKNSEPCDISVVEGVMGFYDGMGGNTNVNSSCDISNELDIPVILVVNCKGASLSVVAMIKGYIDFSKNNIKAVILNNVSKPMYPLYKKMIEATGGSFGIRNIGLLESAIQNSKATFEGIELYPTTVEKCSKYMLF
ncbi:MAG: AAA family ATPase, partial [Clostridiales bacterium]|nr:AAA family ATPase [Clostridiales bacterium]